jgi:hypothetical protein
MTFKRSESGFGYAGTGNARRADPSNIPASQRQSVLQRETCGGTRGGHRVGKFPASCFKQKFFGYRTRVINGEIDCTFHTVYRTMRVIILRICLLRCICLTRQLPHLLVQVEVERFVLPFSVLLGIHRWPRRVCPCMLPETCMLGVFGYRNT